MKTEFTGRFSEPLRREIAIVGPLVAGFAGLLGTVLIGAPNALDREVTTFLQGLPWQGLGFIPQLGSDVGGGVYGTLVIPAAAAAWFAVTRRWKLLLLVAGAFALHYVLISPKLFVTAYRPSPAFGVEGGGGMESFPSGHVQWAASFYGLIAYLMLQNARRNGMRAAIVGAYVLIVGLTMLGRIELGRHWLTDTVAGVLAGLVAVRILVALHRWPALDRLVNRLERRLVWRAPAPTTA